MGGKKRKQKDTNFRKITNFSNSTTQLETMFPKMNEPIANKKITKIFPPSKIIAKKTSKEKINSEEEKG